MENFKEHPAKKSSAKSFNELINLLLKLNAKILEKIGPSPKRKANGPVKTDLVIIIMSNQEEKIPGGKSPRSSKAEPAKGDWIQDLCEEIERGPHTWKRS